VQISSDFVFDGESSKPISPGASKIPKSIYGSHKSELENHLLEECLGASIIRISGLTVFSGKSKTFLEKIIAKAYSQDQISVVSDLTHSIVLDSLIASNLEMFENPKSAITHIVNSGAVSWFEMADMAIKVLGIPCKVNPIFSESLNLPAKRPNFSVLEPDPGLKQQLDWRIALERHLLHEKDKYQLLR
jgi:dTDP-4-dehydrorhamnose reductase